MPRYELINRTTEQPITAAARLLARPIERARGLMFNRDVPPDAAYIFPYDRIGRRGVHMLGVFEALDVVWLQRHRVHHKETLRPWRGYAAIEADAFIEFPAGGADGITIGDRLDWGPR